MSDTQQQPDWWKASDGKWYAPELPPPPKKPAPRWVRLLVIVAIALVAAWVLLSVTGQSSKNNAKDYVRCVEQSASPDECK